VTCGLRSWPPGPLHRVPARTPGSAPGLHLPGAAGRRAGEPGRASPGQIVLLPTPPAAQAGRMAARRYIMTARAARAAVKAETRMASAVMLPPGAAARSPTAAVSPAPGRPATRPRSSLAPAAVLLFPACDCPNRKSRQLARLGDGWPTREHLAGWRGGDQTGQVPLPSIRQAEVHRYEYIANGADRASQPIRSSFNSPAQKRGRRIRAGPI